LLLKVLEGENNQTIEKQLKFYHERALPDLGDNIKCGNSLIGTDFYHNDLFVGADLCVCPDSRHSQAKGRTHRCAPTSDSKTKKTEQKQVFDDEERYRINVFDWEKEFSGIMKSGGFDAVIGNPPYVVIGSDVVPVPVIAYLKAYEVAQYKVDLFHLFIQRGIDLLKKDGKFGYIIPNTWLTLQYTDKLRKYVLDKTLIDQVVVFDQRVFQAADVHTALLFLTKGTYKQDHSVLVKKPVDVITSQELVDTKPISITQKTWINTEGYCFETRLVGSVGQLATKIMRAWPRLDSVARASLGCQAYNRSKHTPEQIEKRVFHADHKVGKDYLPELAGKDVDRYLINRQRGEWIKYGSWLHDYRTMDWLQGPRILIREIAGQKPYQIHACYVEETYCNYKTILNVNPVPATKFSMKYLLGLLNSRLMSFIYPYVSNKMVAQSFPRLSVGDVKKLPVRTINFSDPADKARHDKMVALVEQMLSLNKQLASAKTDHEKTALQRQIEAIDKQIDKLVYELYGLTDEEIRIVEGVDQCQ